MTGELIDRTWNENIYLASAGARMKTREHIRMNFINNNEGYESRESD